MPPLVPTGLLEELEANIDYKKNEIDFQKLGAKDQLFRVGQGYRAINLLNFGATPVSFNVSPKVLRDFGSELRRVL